MCITLSGFSMHLKARVALHDLDRDDGLMRGHDRLSRQAMRENIRIQLGKYENYVTVFVRGFMLCLSCAWDSCVH